MDLHCEENTITTWCGMVISIEINTALSGVRSKFFSKKIHFNYVCFSINRLIAIVNRTTERIDYKSLCMQGQVMLMTSSL